MSVGGKEYPVGNSKANHFANVSAWVDALAAILTEAHEVYLLMSSLLNSSRQQLTMLFVCQATEIKSP